MSGQSLRHKFGRQFMGMERYSRTFAWLVVASYVGWILASIALGHFLLSQETTFLNVTLMVLVAVFIGTRLRGLNNIVHECSHSSFSAHREDNVRIGRFCTAVLTGCFSDYKRNHLSHHAHLGDYEHDREFQPIEKFRLHEPLTGKRVVQLFFAPLLFQHIKEYSGVNMSGADGKFFLGLKIALLLVMFVFAIFAPWTALFFAFIPLFYIFPTLNFWTDCLDHAGIVGVKDELEASRNVLAPMPVRLLFFPRNDCYHLVHHLFPQVPARHLDSAHHVLTKDASYRNQPLAVRPIHKGMVESLRSAPTS